MAATRSLIPIGNGTSTSLLTLGFKVLGFGVINNASAASHEVELLHLIIIIIKGHSEEHASSRRRTRKTQNRLTTPLHTSRYIYMSKYR